MKNALKGNLTSVITDNYNCTINISVYVYEGGASFNSNSKNYFASTKIPYTYIQHQKYVSKTNFNFIIKINIRFKNSTSKDSCSNIKIHSINK